MIDSRKKLKRRTVSLIVRAFINLNKDSDVKSFNVSLRKAISLEESPYRLSKRTSIGCRGLYKCLSEKGNITLTLLIRVLEAYNLGLCIIHRYSVFSSQSNKDNLIHIRNVAKEMKRVTHSPKKRERTIVAYDAISKTKNPYLKSLMPILKALNLKISVVDLPWEPEGIRGCYSSHEYGDYEQ